MGVFTNKVVGIFNDRTVIDALLLDLNSMGYESGDISVLAKDDDPGRNREYVRAYVVNVPDAVVMSNVGAEVISHKETRVDLIKSKGLRIDNNFDENHEVIDKDPASMVKGAATGGTVGLLVGLGLLLIPGIGPVLASGPLLAVFTAAVAGAAVGASAGTLIGLLKDEGIPLDRAELYSNHFNNGDVLVVVGTGDDTRIPLIDLFTKYNASTVDTF